MMPLFCGPSLPLNLLIPEVLGPGLSGHPPRLHTGGRPSTRIHSRNSNLRATPARTSQPSDTTSALTRAPTWRTPPILSAAAGSKIFRPLSSKAARRLSFGTSSTNPTSPRTLRRSRTKPKQTDLPRSYLVALTAHQWLPRRPMSRASRASRALSVWTTGAPNSTAASLPARSFFPTG